ncbi:MAG: hypothetical protein ACK4NF_02805, partial [Planctomycetota bacterium]
SPFYLLALSPDNREGEDILSESKECKIISKGEAAKPTVKLDPKNKKWFFAINLKTGMCNGLNAVIDIYYEEEGNSLLGSGDSSCSRLVEIQSNVLKFECSFTSESQYPSPSSNYYYKIEIIPDLQDADILKKIELKDTIRFIQKFEIGNEEEQQKFFDEYIEKLSALVKLANLLFKKVMDYHSKYIELKSIVEEGACKRWVEEKVRYATQMLQCSFRGSTDCGSNIDPFNETVCTMWRNYVDRSWISFEEKVNESKEEERGTDSKEEERGASSGAGSTGGSAGGKLEEKEKILTKESIKKTVEFDENLKSLLSSLDISIPVSEEKKEVEWIDLYNYTSQFVNSFYSKRVIMLAGIVEKISELYSKSLKQYILCVKDILKDGTISDIEYWGNCPKTEKLLLEKGYTADNLYQLFTITSQNIEQRINEAKYPEEIRKLRTDIRDSIEKIYDFFNNVNTVIKTGQKVPETKAKEINELFNSYLVYFNDLKEIYVNPPKYREYTEVYTEIRSLIDNERELLNSFNRAFVNFVNNVKNFRGYPREIQNLHTAVARNLSEIAHLLKDSELDSMLKKSWARIAPEYEKEKIEKIEVIPKPEQIQPIFNQAKTLLKNNICIFKYEEDPQTKKQKLVSLDTLFDELKKNKENPGIVNDYILKQPYFEEIEKNELLCCRKLTFKWIKEILHDRTFDPLLETLIKKYGDAILKISLPLDKEKYEKLDALVVDLVEVYKILTAKAEKGLLSKETPGNIKPHTIKLLDGIRGNAANFYTTITNKLSAEITNAGTDREKLKTINETYFKELNIEIKDDEDNVKVYNQFVPYIALLAGILEYISLIQDSGYIKPLIYYIDESFLVEEERLRVELIPKTLEKIGIDKIIPIEEFRKSITLAQEVATNEKQIKKIKDDLDAITEKIVKNAPEAKKFEDAYKSASETDRKEYDRLEAESMKILLQTTIFCSICQQLKQLKERILEKIK